MGTLFFVELIAFFMLRQFRMLTEDYRYFEAILRQREANLAIYLAAGQRNESDWRAIVNRFHHDDGCFRLRSGETNEILEAKKISGDDLDFIGRLANALRSIWRP